MKDHKVKAYIRKRLDEMCLECGVSAERIIQEYARLAFSDMRDFADWKNNDVQWKDSSKLEDHMAAAISDISETTVNINEVMVESRMNIKLHPKTQALAQLAKIKKLVNDNDHTIKLPDELTEFLTNAASKPIKRR